MYRKKSFSVPASAGGTCEPFRHSMADVKGNCLRCGERIPSKEEQIHAQMKHQYLESSKAGARMLEAAGFDGIEFARALMGADFLDAETKAGLGEIVDRCDAEGHTPKADPSMERGLVEHVSQSLQNAR